MCVSATEFLLVSVASKDTNVKCQAVEDRSFPSALFIRSAD